MAKEAIRSVEALPGEVTRIIPEPPEGEGQDSLSNFIPRPGQALGPVRLMGELGHGAMGVVFLGHHTVLGRDVAVKVLTTRSPKLKELGARRLADEARAAAAVRDPHLAEIYDANLQGDTPYLVMEYLDGPTLGQLLARVGRLSAPLAVGVMLEVSTAVARLHEHGIIHRDLKPSNVLLGPRGRIVVSDFGLAILPTPEAPIEALPLAGTPAYMAPEVFAGRISAASDIYALGIMTFQLLTGTLPFEGTLQELREQHQQAPFPIELLRGAGVEPALVDVIGRAAQKQPQERFRSAQDLHEAFRQIGVDPAAARLGLEELIAGAAHPRSPIDHRQDR